MGQRVCDRRGGVMGTITALDVPDMLHNIGAKYATDWFDCVEYTLGNVCITMNSAVIRISPRVAVNPSYEFEATFPVNMDELMGALAKAVLIYGG